MKKSFKPKVKSKPNPLCPVVVNYWKSGDPCQKIHILQEQIFKSCLVGTEQTKKKSVTVIRTKNLTDEFITWCINMQNSQQYNIYLHVVITGMGGTMLEPKIGSVRTLFYQIKKLIDNGFSNKSILVCIDPILPNDNGLRALKLLLKVFTEFKPLRLRFVRFRVMNYKQLDNGKYVVGNDAILKRQSTKQIMKYLLKVDSFFRDYYKLVADYSNIICIDKGEEALIGIKELIVFGFQNRWFNTQTQREEQIIRYDGGNKFKPIVNLISPAKAVRCNNRCLLCPYWG